ncbi:hypothetical protein [Kitasatospora sp. NPDC093806]|uniref:hypothetical protein n=1 Tax=Kitasatospora sp. NPDC093806 TaxID=3155075 RepID=UPI0034174688
MKFERDVSPGDWRDPAKERRLYARARTELGEVVLHRARARRGGEAQWDGWEEWTISLEGEEILVLHDMASPGVAARRRVQKTVHGSFAGTCMNLSGRHSPLSSGRSVVFATETGTIRFRTHRFSAQALSPQGEVVAERRSGDWGGVRAEVNVVAAVCVFEWGGLDGFLESPLLQFI